MPNAGLPVLGKDGAEYPLTPEELADAHDTFTREYGLSLVGGCCGTTPEHLRQVVERVRGREVAKRTPTYEAGGVVALLERPVPPGVVACSWWGSGPTPTVRRPSARRCSTADWNNVIEIARDAARDGAHMIDVCVDYVGRDGAIDMHEVAGRYATASTLPIMLDSTEPAVIEAGLERLGGRCLINSVNFEDGDGPDSRWSRVLPIITEHGAAVVALTIDEQGQARTAENKVAIAERLIADLTVEVGDPRVRHLRRHPHLHPGHRAGGVPQGRRGDDRGHPGAQAQAPGRPHHPRPVEHLLRPQAGRARGAEQRVPARVPAGRADAAIVHASKILPMNRIPDEQREVALDLIYDRRKEGYDPLTRSSTCSRASRAARTRSRAGQELARAAARRAAPAPHHRRREERPRGRPRRGAAGEARARHRQRHAAGRDEGRRRAVRLRPDAAAVRAAVGARS